MTPENWQIGLIKSLTSFSYQSMHDLAFKQAWALDNLRPFSAKHNLSYGARRNKT